MATVASRLSSLLRVVLPKTNKTAKLKSIFETRDQTPSSNRINTKKHSPTDQNRFSHSSDVDRLLELGI